MSKSIKITDEKIEASATALVTPQKPGGWMCWVYENGLWNMFYPVAPKSNWRAYPGPLFESREQALKEVAENRISATEVKLFELRF